MADTIEIIQGTATTVEVAGPTGPQGPSGSVGATGATGPAGPAGTGIETLTTKGDLLSRNDSAAIRVGIGSTGQVLKVSAQGLPTWANESGAVTSVNGATGAVTIPTYENMGPGLVPNAIGSAAGRFLRGDSTWTYPLVGEVTGLSDALAAKQNTGDYVTPTRVETEYFDRGGDNAATRPGTGGQKRYQVVLSNDTRLIDQRSIAWITPAPSSPTNNTENPPLGSVSYDGNYLYVLVQTPGSQSRRWGRVPMPLNWT